ncbi:hypothetical protein B0A48_08533 [Cryoendolithus antarcticus]|uniref:Uncharacterized protein n=1 Tax=Cryoendolithus antarcticus TaxID=1507870 RepID=A0A1V8T5Q7_9PEZI|nr:hypothetical protein B0A48_08533 [Cryoendolithus antarcticus]
MSGIWHKSNKTFVLFGTVLQMPSQSSKKPVVLLFDIGGVCVASPFQAITDYEKSLSIPNGWINYAISAASPNGAWQKLERGEVALDASFFTAWNGDLQHQQRWRTFYARHLASTRKESFAQAAEEAAFDVPPPPEIDSEKLYWNMMTYSRTMDPDMYPALQRLRKAANANPGSLVIGAMSNTSIFPDGHPFNDTKSADGRKHAEMKSNFDVFVSSAHSGLRKPDEPIYEYTLEGLRKFVKEKGWRDDIQMSDVVFLDDIGSNLRTGKALGMRTIKVNLGRVGEAVAELESITGLSLREGKAKL